MVCWPARTCFLCFITSSLIETEGSIYASTTLLFVITCLLHSNGSFFCFVHFKLFFFSQNPSMPIRWSFTFQTFSFCRFPFYYHTKLAFLVWLQLPSGNVCNLKDALGNLWPHLSPFLYNIMQERDSSDGMWFITNYKCFFALKVLWCNICAFGFFKENCSNKMNSQWIKLVAWIRISWHGFVHFAGFFVEN